MAEFDKHTSVYGDLQEVVDLEGEIKRMSKHLKDLRIQKKEAEARIFEFLQEKDQVGFKYKDMVVTVSERKARQRRNLESKKEEILQVLRSARDPTSKQALEDILEATKGDTVTRNCIKVQKTKKL